MARQPGSRIFPSSWQIRSRSRCCHTTAHGEIKSRIVYLADPELALKHLGHNSVERGMLDLLRPWFRMNVVEFEPYVAAHSRFLVYGDFVRLSFLNWLLPELHARGWRTELLNLGGDDLLLLASRDDGATRRRRPQAGRRAHRRPCGAVARDRQATHAQQPTPARYSGVRSQPASCEVPHAPRARRACYGRSARTGSWLSS